MDSIILASSDSDFWSVIEDVDANYFVLLEKTKYGSDFKSLLWNNIIFYCYLDKFMTPEKDKFFDTVFKKELEKVIANSFVFQMRSKSLEKHLRKLVPHYRLRRETTFTTLQ